MEKQKLTISQAIAEGYEYCGYADIDWQTLMQISDLDSDDFETGQIFAAGKEEQHTQISADEIRDMVSDRCYERHGEATNDDTDTAIDAVKNVAKVHFERLAEAVNAELKKHWYRSLTEVEIIPDEPQPEKGADHE